MTLDLSNRVTICTKCWTHHPRGYQYCTFCGHVTMQINKGRARYLKAMAAAEVTDNARDRGAVLRNSA